MKTRLQNEFLIFFSFEWNGDKTFSFWIAKAPLPPLCLPLHLWRQRMAHAGPRILFHQIMLKLIDVSVDCLGRKIEVPSLQPRGTMSWDLVLKSWDEKLSFQPAEMVLLKSSAPASFPWLVPIFAQFPSHSGWLQLTVQVLGWWLCSWVCCCLLQDLEDLQRSPFPLEEQGREICVRAAVTNPWRNLSSFSLRLFFFSFFPLNKGETSLVFPTSLKVLSECNFWLSESLREYWVAKGGGCQFLYKTLH